MVDDGSFFFLSPQREKKGSKVFLHGTCSNVKEPCPEKWCALEQQDMKYESTLFKMPLTPFFVCLFSVSVFTGIYRVLIGFFCNIYGRGQKESQRNPIPLNGKIVEVMIQ